MIYGLERHLIFPKLPECTPDATWDSHCVAELSWSPGMHMNWLVTAEWICKFLRLKGMQVPWLSTIVAQEIDPPDGLICFQHLPPTLVVASTGQALRSPLCTPVLGIFKYQYLYHNNVFYLYDRSLKWEWLWLTPVVLQMLKSSLAPRTKQKSTIAQKKAGMLGISWLLLANQMLYNF